MDDQQAREAAAIAVHDTECSCENPAGHGTVTIDFRRAVANDVIDAYLAALPVAPEQPTQASEEQLAEAWKTLAAERWGSKGEDHPLMPAWFRTGYRLGLAAALVSSPSVETVTPDKETRRERPFHHSWLCVPTGCYRPSCDCPCHDGVSS